MLQNKKTLISSILALSIFIQSFANWIFFATPTVQAATPSEENKIVALFVQDSIATTIQPSLEWYTTTYIQARFPKTKVLVFPIDTTTMTPLDIQKIITNLYHGGEKDTPSTLIGTILVGNIPLPIIKQDNYIVPSMLPYTDIEKPSFIYDPTSSYFLPSTYPTDNRQELFHGVIRFDTTNEYTTYFDKLKTYLAQPETFADKKFWFDDFTKLEEHFTNENVGPYLQGQIHGEDISYHRFSQGLFTLLKDGANDEALSILQSA